METQWLDATRISRMIHNLTSIRDYYQVEGTNEDGINEAISFLQELREDAWKNKEGAA